MDKARVIELRQKLDVVLADFASNNGLDSLKLGNCSYNPSGSFTFKLEGVNSGGVSKVEANYEHFQLLGRNAMLPKLHAYVQSNDETYQIKGMKERGNKCILITRVRDSKNFVCTIRQLEGMKLIGQGSGVTSGPVNPVDQAPVSKAAPKAPAKSARKPMSFERKAQLIAQLAAARAKRGA